MKGFTNDNGGVALKLDDVKLINAKVSTWSTRLSQQIGNSKNRIFICTRKLMDLEYLKAMFSKRSENIFIIANNDNKEIADELKKSYPELDISLYPGIHANMVLIEPETVWLSSADFGKSDQFDQTIGIHDRKAYDFYLGQMMSYCKSFMEAPES